MSGVQQGRHLVKKINKLSICKVAVLSFPVIPSKTHLNLHTKDQGHADIVIYLVANGAVIHTENTL